MRLLGGRGRIGSLGLGKGTRTNCILTCHWALVLPMRWPESVFLQLMKDVLRLSEVWLGLRGQKSPREAEHPPPRGRMHPPFPEAPSVLPACSGGVSKSSSAAGLPDSAHSPWVPKAPAGPSFNSFPRAPCPPEGFLEDPSSSLDLHPGLVFSPDICLLYSTQCKVKSATLSHQPGMDPASALCCRDSPL